MHLRNPTVLLYGWQYTLNEILAGMFSQTAAVHQIYLHYCSPTPTTFQQCHLTGLQAADIWFTLILVVDRLHFKTLIMCLLL